MVGNVLCGIIFVPKDDTSRQHLCYMEGDAFILEWTLPWFCVINKKGFPSWRSRKKADVDVFFREGQNVWFICVTAESLIWVQQVLLHMRRPWNSSAGIGN